MSLPTALVMAVAAPAAGGGGLQDMVLQFAPLLFLLVAGYFLLIRPQQQRQREHVKRVSALKRGDTVVMSNGMLGKVVRVEDDEIGVEIAQNVTVKMIKSMVHDIRTRGEPAAANDKS
ncbi:MAG TPA: preprotein translocase subunit YajC [Caulobacteraceae bacterium]|nr:preprotein translocase subunit YajC [Caulobacteraceae bacterium]